jgi:rhomboid protease GluP
MFPQSNPDPNSAPPPAPPPAQQSNRVRVRLPVARPLFTYIFLGMCIVIWLAMELLYGPQGGSESAQVLVLFGANVGVLVKQGQFWRLLTANFLHIGLLHLAVNMYALYALGREVEALFGRARFVALYLLTGICGAIFSYMMQSPRGISAGASTSLFGLFGALAVFYYRQRGLLGNLGQQRLLNLGVVLAINVAIALVPGSTIDLWGHFGGLVGGAILGWFLCPKYEWVNPFERAFSPAINQADDAARGAIRDSNTLARQSLSVGLFMLGLVALTIVATLMKS